MERQQLPGGRPLEHPQPICSVLSGLHLRVALSGCIDV